MMGTQTSNTPANVNPLTVTGEDYGPDNPQTVIRILVDTAYVATTAPGTNGAITNGAYMVDNRASNGSSAEGGLELHTVAHMEDFVGFYVEPVDPTTQDTVRIVGIQALSNDVFTSAGEPRMRDTKGQIFVGQILNNAFSTYRLQCELTVNGLSVEKIPFWWDPYLGVN
ncbi:hypothetical protein [Bordetella flabilis]|uniref:hypothetical protein n=1 Tax=Bordetella flabilis TaxID=463014 RepID=UPI0012F4A545|nr:hypothetical protein [Bordetella flabilis]